MIEVAPLSERLSAYRRIVGETPSLSVADRLHLFTLAVCPGQIERHAQVLTWEHFQQCREKNCLLCADGELADGPAE